MNRSPKRSGEAGRAEPTLVDAPTLEREGKRRSASGWFAGVMLGAFVGLWMLPPVRYTLSSQMGFALAQDSLPWLRTFDAQRSPGETARLDAASALLPDDYLLQVGRATAFDTPDDTDPAQNFGSDPANPAASPRSRAPLPDANSSSQAASDHALIRLTTVARDFSFAPGAQAHLARSMMAHRIRIQRPELTAAAPRLIPPRYTDVKLMTWALRNGERADPNNAFWPAMLAVTYFAAGRDQQALDALGQCGQKSRWDSYLYEEVLGQWRLYSLAYGDHGAAQKIGPLTLLAFPHLHEISRMALTARLAADRAAARGEVTKAIQIRRAIRLLGHILRDNATWAYEALYGTDLLLISACDGDSAARQSSIRTVPDWEQQAQDYLGFLRRNGKVSEITVLYTEVEDSCRLRAQVDVAREDASYPGIPPGIPLISLFSDWMAGVSLLQQAALLALCVTGARLWRPRRTRSPRYLRAFAHLPAYLFTLGVGTLLFTTLPSSRLAVLFEVSVCALFVLACDRLQAFALYKRRQSKPDLQEHTPDLSCETEASDPRLREHWREHWRRGTTLRFLVVTSAGTGLLLYSLRGLFSSLHPVALLLSSMMGIAPPTTGLYALQVGLLACALPLVLVVSLCAWALRRGFAVLPTVVYGLRRMFAPALTALALAYLLLLNQTLRLDAEATHAINEAARDDLHWVLTHSEGDD